MIINGKWMSETEIIALISQLTADKKRLENQAVKRGEWIARTGYGGWGEQYYNCSCCNNEVEEKKNFCDECGADMRGTEI